ncbi:DNA-processing protein DprA [Thalassobacillus pellis]|uniref:DNA-processing protein DprA n=1 Tax=Thalassobacillus pellis TaxID=748008 RepID=UPI0019616EAE|nr:DNA-processing protein DprA [Thalassobacillus pellis]MBM7552763.1 DNA processing protein [Thalassobacillus pellis]
MYNRRSLLLHLHASPHMTRGLLRKILKFDSSLASIMKLSPSDITSIFHIPMPRAISLAEHLRSIAYKNDNLMKEYATVTIFDEEYPEIYKTIPDPPLVLYAAGDISLLKKVPALSVVGTRKPSVNAYSCMESLLTPLITAGFTIVSGLAVGIDRFAHEIALRYHGTTIGILGSGFHHIYPKANISLFQQMLQKNLVITEYHPDTRPQKFHFPERNRLISGLTDATLVIEAKARSGSLITVEQALEQGKEVFAVPGSILNPNSEGCHQIIQEGAKLVRNTQDILRNWPEY